MISFGKSGWSIFKPTSSVGTYLGTAVSEAIPGSGIASMLIRSTASTAVKYATDCTLSNEKPNLSDVIGDFTLNMLGEGVSAGINKVYDVVSPRNYSSFRHQITRRIPHITQQQTKHAMNAFLKSLIAAKKALGFTVNVITSRDY